MKKISPEHELEKEEPELRATFWEHLEELRRTLIAILLIVIFGILISCVFYTELFSLLTRPLNIENREQENLQTQELVYRQITNRGENELFYALPSDVIQIKSLSSGTKKISDNAYLLSPGASIEISQAARPHTLFFFGPLEGIHSVFKICLWVGLVCTSPLWLWLVLGFIAPALEREQRRAIPSFLLLSFLFLSAGLAFAYNVIIPLANHYLLTFNEEIGTNFWSASQYLDYTVILLLANALAFELSLLLFFLVHYQTLTAERLASNRRLMIVAAFILGALFTPPDVPSQLMLATVFIILYELAILYARFRGYTTTQETYAKII